MTTQARIVSVTPTQAEEWLESNFRNNRTMNVKRVRAYAADMTKGLWTFNGEGVKFATDGSLIDGQHRLAAVVKANVDVEMLVVEGLEPSTMITMDTQMGRSLANVLTILSYDRASELARVLPMADNYETYMEDKVTTVKGGSPSSVVLRNHQDKAHFARNTARVFTRQNALALLERRPSLMDSIAIMSPISNSRTQNVRPQIATVALMHNIAKFGYGGATVVEYVEAVRSGEGTVDMPTYRLHHALVRAKQDNSKGTIPPYIKAGMWMRGYEQWIGDTGVTQAKRLSGNLYPTIPGDVEWYLDGKEA